MVLGALLHPGSYMQSAIRNQSLDTRIQMSTAPHPPPVL